MNILYNETVVEDNEQRIVWYIKPHDSLRDDMYEIGKHVYDKTDIIPELCYEGHFPVKLTYKEFIFAQYHLVELYEFWSTVLMEKKSLYIKKHDSNYPDRVGIRELTDITNIEQVVHYMDIYLHKENQRVNISDNQYIEICVDDVKRLKEGIIK